MESVETGRDAINDNASELSYSAHNDGESRNSSHADIELAQKETRAVFKLRVLVILVLFLAAVCVCLVVYFVTKNAQEHEFKTQFEGSAEKVLSSFTNIVQEKMSAVATLCLTITAQVQSRNLTWPFVTLDAFQEQAKSARILSKVLRMTLLPLVTEENRAAWEVYSLQNVNWLQEAYAYQNALEENGFTGRLLDSMETPQPFGVRRQLNGGGNSTTPNAVSQADPEAVEYVNGISSRIWALPPNSGPLVDPGPGPYAPLWQSSPVTNNEAVNLNIFKVSDLISTTFGTGEMAFGGYTTPPPGNISSPQSLSSFFANLLSIAAKKAVEYKGDPITETSFPVFSNFGENRTVAAALTVHFLWATYFEDILPPNAKGVLVILENACDGTYTYRVDGKSVKVVGFGEHSDSKFERYKESSNFNDIFTIADGSHSGITINHSRCPYAIHVHPTQELYDQYNTNTPLVITLSIGFIFIFTAVMFIVYDRLVEKRQKLVLRTAQLSSEIVSSLFPENIRNRLMQSKGAGHEMIAPNHRLKSYLKDGSLQSSAEIQPIADLFPHTTVMFADISGFTAWSSTREPAQVFILLQTVYQAFDAIAKRREVFKVETIGDSYVAVAGLPNPQPNHAVIMATFAWECKEKMKEIVRALEVTLGPDTADLSMRFGIHSGPVTAGVLLGERARFQLFGDTVNTASRMESTGERNMIQASNITANLLVAAGKGHWLKPRQNAIIAKGKGVLNTFWVFPKNQEEEETSEPETKQNLGLIRKVDAKAEILKQSRLIEWMTELLTFRLKQIMARRRKRPSCKTTETEFLAYAEKPLDEVVEVMVLPKFDQSAVAMAQDISTVEIPPETVAQLREYVSIISSTYRDNPFHNFEHACHVTMAVDKFLRRIVAPEIDLDQLSGGDDAINALASHLHNYTHGINSDPLTLFGIVFSALIHDVDHRGVSNAQLMREDEKMAALYQNKSVAEQNSFDISWNLLMSDTFKDLRGCLFDGNLSELARFRQIVVNVVMATDIFDKELNDLRKNRWNKAFDEQEPATIGQQNDLKATIVIEHIMQASDVAHTMQHWHIYRKWNERLFKEMYLAHQTGRMEADPATFWYQGELGFFDNYIVPLAKKLKDCNVFGVSSEECLNYAMQNRAEWEERGAGIVTDMVLKLSEEFLVPTEDPPVAEETPTDRVTV